MATTTTNFGWDIPQSTDLVKDGATAIAALGQDIDTALVDLKGGTTGQVLAKASGTDLDFSWVAQDDSNAIQNAIVDAKGDLISATANDTPARLAVGTNGHVLTADSSTATGIKWAAATGPTPSYSLLGSATLTGAATITVSGLSGYDSLFVTVLNATCGTASSFMTFKFNSAAANHSAFGNNINGQSSYGMGLFSVINSANTGSVQFGRCGTNVGSKVLGTIDIKAANTTGVKPFLFNGAGDPGGGTDPQIVNGGGFFNAAAVISTISLISSAGNFTGGTLSVYGSVV